MDKKIVARSVQYTGLSLVASVMNFAFYPVIAFFLTKAEFGDVQIGVSFIMVAASLFAALSTLAIFSSALGKDDGHTIQHLERLIIAISLVLIAATLIASAQITAALQLADGSLLYILAFIFLLNIPAGTWIGTLQGQGQFVESGWISLASALTKIVSAIFFIEAGMGAVGALIGVALGTLLMLPLVKFFQHKNLASFRKTFTLLNLSDIHFLKKSPSILIVLTCLVMLSFAATIDVLWAKSHLSPHDAGIFAQISTAAKIPYFATIPLAIILFERFAKQSINAARSFGIYSGIVVSLAMGVWLMGPMLLRMLFRIELTHSGIWDLLVMSFAGYSILVLIFYRFIAVRKTGLLAAASVFMIICGFILLETFGKNPPAIAASYLSTIITSLLLCIALGYTTTYENR